MMFGVFAVRHDVWCFSSQTRCLVFATHGVGWSLVWVGLPNVYSYYEAWGKPEQQASFMCFLIFHRPSGFAHLFLSVVFLFLATITCHVKAQEVGSQTSCGKRRGWSRAQGCVRWADKLKVLVQRQASVPAGWSSRGHLFCSRLFFAQSWISGGGWWWRTGRPAESTTAGHGFQRSAACQLPSFFDLLLVILVLKWVLISVLVAVAVRVSFAAHCLKGVLFARDDENVKASFSQHISIRECCIRVKMAGRHSSNVSAKSAKFKIPWLFFVLPKIKPLEYLFQSLSDLHFLFHIIAVKDFVSSLFLWNTSPSCLHMCYIYK